MGISGVMVGVGATASSVGSGVAVGGWGVGLGGKGVAVGPTGLAGGGSVGVAVGVAVGVGSIAQVSVVWQREHWPRGWPDGREWQELQLVYVTWSKVTSVQLPVL